MQNWYTGTSTRKQLCESNMYLKTFQHEADVVRKDGEHVDNIEGSFQEGHLLWQTEFSFVPQVFKEFLDLFWGTG